MNSVVFGSCNFSVASLRALVRSNSLNSISVVTPPDDDGPLLKYAVGKGLPVIRAPSGSSLKSLQLPNKDKFDIGIVVSFGYFIPKRIISQFRFGMINLHPSLLPKYRGAAPIQHALMNGDSTTGISIIKIHPDRFDCGDILYQNTVDVDDQIMYPQLHDRLAKVGAHGLVNVVDNLEYYLRAAQEQNSDCPMFARKIERRLAYLDFRSHTAKQIFNLYRGISHQFSLHTKFLDNEVHLIHLKAVRDTFSELELLAMKHRDLTSNSMEPGTVFLNEITNTLFVRCLSSSENSNHLGNWLPIKLLQFPTRPPITPNAFFRANQFENFKSKFTET